MTQVVFDDGRLTTFCDKEESVLINPIHMLAYLQQQRAAMGSRDALEIELHDVHARQIVLETNCQLICAGDESRVSTTITAIGDSYELLQIKEAMIYTQLRDLTDLENQILDLETELQEQDQAELRGTYIALQVLPES